MKKFENIRQAVNQEFPMFDIASIKKIGEGDNSKAFLINQQYVFRFPKSEEVKQQLAKEIAVLPRIRSQLNFEIPNFDFISNEINFVGHKIISGKFLSNKIYNSLEKTFQEQILQSHAAFLSQLHSINLASLKDCRLETMNLKEEYSDDFENIQKLIFPNIPAKSRKIITHIFTYYLGNSKNFDYAPTLIHNDFSAGHILVDISRKEISGIIDFGDMAIGDPDYDLMYLFDYFGLNFIKRLFHFYNPGHQRYLLEKLHFFVVANKLQIILSEIKDNSQYAEKVGYKNLETWFREYLESEVKP